MAIFSWDVPDPHLSEPHIPTRLLLRESTQDLSSWGVALKSFPRLKFFFFFFFFFSLSLSLSVFFSLALFLSQSPCNLLGFNQGPRTGQISTKSTELEGVSLHDLGKKTSKLKSTENPCFPDQIWRAAAWVEDGGVIVNTSKFGGSLR